MRQEKEVCSFVVFLFLTILVFDKKEKLALRWDGTTREE